MQVQDNVHKGTKALFFLKGKKKHFIIAHKGTLSINYVRLRVCTGKASHCFCFFFSLLHGQNQGYISVGCIVSDLNSHKDVFLLMSIETF